MIKGATRTTHSSNSALSGVAPTVLPYDAPAPRLGLLVRLAANCLRLYLPRSQHHKTASRNRISKSDRRFSTYEGTLLFSRKCE